MSLWIPGSGSAARHPLRFKSAIFSRALQLKVTLVAAAAGIISGLAKKDTRHNSAGGEPKKKKKKKKNRLLKIDKRQAGCPL